MRSQTCASLTCCQMLTEVPTHVLPSSLQSCGSCTCKGWFWFRGMSHKEGGLHFRLKVHCLTSFVLGRLQHAISRQATRSLASDDAQEVSGEKLNLRTNVRNQNRPELQRQSQLFHPQSVNRFIKQRNHQLRSAFSWAARSEVRRDTDGAWLRGRLQHTICLSGPP